MNTTTKQTKLENSIVKFVLSTIEKESNSKVKSINKMSDTNSELYIDTENNQTFYISVGECFKTSTFNALSVED